MSEICNGAWQDFRQYCIYTYLQQQKSQDDEIINPGESQEYEVELAFSEDATSEIQNPAPTAHWRAPKRKRGKLTLSYQEEMISFENRKLD